MNKKVKKLMSLLIVLVMLLNVGGVYAETAINKTEDFITESDQSDIGDIGDIENLEDSGEIEPGEQEPEQEELGQEEPGQEEAAQEEPGQEELELGNLDLGITPELQAESVTLDYETNGVEITVYANAGILPQDTTLSVNPILESESQNYVQMIKENTGTSLGEFIAFDITLLDSGGNEVQPNGQVEVSFSGIEFIREAKEIIVYHLEPNISNRQRSMMGTMGSRSTETSEDIVVSEMFAQTSDDEVIFSTDHFSIYGVGIEATATYEFYVGDVQVDTQIVMDGEHLYQPEAPEELDNKSFEGWKFEGETEIVDFSKTITVTSPSSVKKVNAVYEDVVYVDFLYDDGDGYDVIATKKINPNSITNSKSVPLVVNRAGLAFSHWSLDENGSEFNFTTPISGDISLYAVLVYRHKITFDAQGGSAILPKYVVDEESIGIVDLTIRPGYIFKHWSLVNNGAAYSVSLPITGDFKLYAVWEANTNTPYTVVYWQENADDDGYTLKEVVQRTGKTETNTTYENKSYAGFTLNSAKTNGENVTITGDESAVKHVYYSRNTYTLIFNESYKSWGTWKTKELKKYPGIKQGADTSFWWNQVVKANPTFSWYTSNGGNISYSLAPDMPKGNLAVYGRESGNTKYTIFYLEEGMNKDIHEPYYFTDEDIEKLTVEDYVAFPGFTVKSTPSDGSQKAIKNNTTGRNEWKLYYTRNKYTITFQKNNLTGNTTISQIPYQSNISDKALAGYMVDVTTRASDAFIFKGWYDNAATVGNPFDFTGKTMPAGNLILYAKWVAPTYTITVHRTLGEGSTTYPRIVHHGETTAKDGLEKDIPVGLSESGFVGWYWYVNDIFVPYDFTMPVNNDFDLYPVWNVKNYKVQYEPGEGTGDPVIDPKSYYIGALAAVFPLPISYEPPTGKVFVGWKIQQGGKIYYPNEELMIAGDMILTAQWGDKVPDTMLTYKANGAVEVDVVVSLKNNGIHQVKQNMFTREGYNFIGWNTKADGSGESFKPYPDPEPDAIDEIIVGNSGPTSNELYAQWTEATYKINYVAGPNGTIEGELEQTVSRGGSSEQVAATPDIGYYFVKWDDSKTEAIRSETKVEANATYTAIFAPREDITYVVNYLEKDTNKVLATAITGTGIYGNEVTETAKVIVGYTVDEATKKLTLAAENNVISFKYTENADVTIIYEAGLGGTIGNTSETLAPVTGVVVGSIAKANAGYVFVDWTNEENEVVGIAVKFVPTKTGDLNVAATYTANFKAVDQTLIYNANGGSGIMENAAQPTDQEFNLATNLFIREGHRFLGWNETPIGNEVEYADEALFKMPAVDATLFAMWVGLKVEKSANKQQFSKAGEIITYTYVVTNTGSITLSAPLPALQPMLLSESLTESLTGSFTLVDDKIGTIDTSSAPETLAPGESFTVTAEYKITKADMNTRFVTNVVKVTGAFGRDDEDVSGEATLTVPLKRKSSSDDPINPTSPTKPKDQEEMIEIDDEEVPLGLPIGDKLNMVDHYQYVMGYPDNTVRPEGLITREEVATVFYRLLVSEYRDSIRTTSHSFQDVQAERWSGTAIATLAKANMVVGYEDGSFRPGNNITRAELATIASRFDNLSPSVSSQFSDIENHWASKFINSASEKGWIHGYEDGTFKPDNCMTRAEFVTLINNVLNRRVKKANILPDAKQFPDLSETKWYYEAMQEAINSHHYTREEDGKHEIWTDIYYPAVEK